MMSTTRPADAMGIESPEERTLIALARAAWAASVESNAIVRQARPSTTCCASCATLGRRT